MSSAVMNSKVSAMDTSMLSVNRNKLMKLAEGIKTKKKPNHKNKTLNFKKDPGYTNIEHLVFGTYRSRPSLSSPTTSDTSPTQLQPAANGGPSTPPESRVKLSPGTFHGIPKRNSGTSGSHEYADVPNLKNGLSYVRHNAPDQLRNAIFGGYFDLEVSDRHIEVKSVNHNVNSVKQGMEPSCSAHLSITKNVNASLGAEITPFYPAGPEMHCGFAEAPCVPLASTNSAMSRLLNGSVHSPPVHLLTHGKYVTREFSADFSSPDTPEQLGSPTLERRPRTIYTADCCMPRSSDEIHSCRGTPSLKLPGSAPRTPPGASRASMKARAKKEVPPPYWSFRGGKPPSAKPGPLRSASLCTANKAVKADARTPPQSECETAPPQELHDAKTKRPPSLTSELPVSKKEFSLPRTNDIFTPSNPDFELSGPVNGEKVPLSSDKHVVANVDVDNSHTVEDRQITDDGGAGALSSRDSGCVLETPPLASPYEKLKPSVPKCVRRIKAASSPVFTDSRMDAWVSESDLHRPWSQICSEKDVERLVQAKSCALSAGSMAAGIESIVQMNPSADAASGTVSTSPTSSQNNLFARFSSMRTPSTRPPGSPVEGVLQKFRKSFSARFYKKVKGESPPSPSSSSTKTARHASFSSYLDDGSCDTDVTLTHNGSLNASSVSDVSIDSAEGETIFRLGPIVWRSSKERKEKSRKLKKVDSKGGESVATESLDGQSICSVKHEIESEINSSCHSTPTNMASYPRPNTYLQCNPLSPQVLRRRSQSTTLHPERLKRPLSDQGSSIHGSITLANPRPNSRNGDVHFTNGNPNPSRRARNGSVGPIMRSSSSDVSSLQSIPIIRRERRTYGLRWSKGRSNLRRSVSQPLEMEKLDGMEALSRSPGGLSDQEDLNHDLSNASSDEEINFNLANGDGGRHHIRKNSRHHLGSIEPVLYAEALWDHVTMDPEELAFKAGDLVEVLDVSDGEWWWGINGNHIGWLPASFVRPRVNQEDTVEECVANMGNGTLHRQNPRKMSISLLSNDQVRTNVIKEIVFTERDFVRHLEDVCEGYLKQMRKRVDMFPEERINTIFGNVEQLFKFQSEFVAKLEQCIDWDRPHLSQIGSCFTEHREGFEMYSEYCNNHPQAVGELQELYTNPKFAHFFEACRLLQEMIDISLDGFLLTPVQKICKYPLQLAELLKYTRPDHPDYKCVSEALDTMRNVAHYINERKRRMECLEKLAAWQMTVEYWEGPDLLDHSSELIYSGEASKVTAAWSRDFTLFLFDHQLIICKKDLLKRNSYSYKGRIDTDTCELKDIPDGKDTHFGLTLKNAWKLYCKDRGKWIIFATRTAEEKQKWMKAFEDERWRVDEDLLQGFVVTDKARKSAVMAVQNRKKPKRPKDKENKNLGRRLTRPDAYVVSTKSGSLPLNVVLTTNKKKTSSGWFHFGSNKKTKR